MGQVFKNPKELVVHIAEDIRLNGVAIQADIAAFQKYLDAQKWEEAGRALGDALALVLFGKVETEEGEVKTKSDREYNAYLVLAGFGTILNANDNDF